MLTRTELKSTDKSKLAKNKRDEEQGLFRAELAELWRNAQRRRSAYIGLLIAQIFRRSSHRVKSSHDIRAIPPLRQVNSP
jgi:hypothetical protein